MHPFCTGSALKHSVQSFTYIPTCDWQVRLGEHANYRSAGTVEFLVDDDTAKFYFLEVRRRYSIRGLLLAKCTDANSALGIEVL